ncbi:MAG: WbqC family protein [Anaerolineales bacterium]|jgi:hypothetical protein
MKVTIHQSYFIPWLGYFSKLAYSDIFVVLDNVHFRKRHYFDRTRIVNMQGEISWLSLPVGQNFQKKCNDVNIRMPDDSYIDRIIKTVEQSYAKARFYDIEWKILRNVLEEPLLNHKNLVNLNVAIIKKIIEFLGMNLPIIYLASNIIKDFKDPTDRVISICKNLQANEIVVGGGSSLDVHDWNYATSKGISVYIQDYLGKHPVYEQSRRKFAGFQNGLSIIDAILNVGREQTRKFLYDGKYQPILFRLEN